MQKLRLIVAILSALIIASLGCPVLAEVTIDEGGKVANPPESLQLEYKFKAGEHRRYDMTINGEGVIKLIGQKEQTKLEAHSELTFIQTAKRYVPEESIWHMQWDMIRGVLTIPEFDEMMITIPPLDFDMDKYGAVRKIKGLDQLAVTSGLPQQKTMGDILTKLKAPGFPQKPVRQGDKWEQEYKIELPDQKPVTIKAVTKLLGFERIEDADCAKIETSYEVPFTLEMKKSDEKAKSSSGAGDAKAEKSTVLVGKETGVACHYFAYDEGKIIQTYGKIELIADIRYADEVSEPVKVEPEKTPQTEEEAKLIKRSHDVSVTYTLVSHYNPEMPEEITEVKE